MLKSDVGQQRGIDINARPLLELDHEHLGSDRRALTKLNTFQLTIAETYLHANCIHQLKMSESRNGEGINHAVVYSSPPSLKTEVVKLPIPEPGPGEVLVRL